jgi:hypothetical protein
MELTGNQFPTRKQLIKPDFDVGKKVFKGKMDWTKEEEIYDPETNSYKSTKKLLNTFEFTLKFDK